MKKRRVRRPLALETVPTRAVGMAPARRMAAKVQREPKRSQAAPAQRRTMRVAVRASTLELAISFWERLRSFLMVTVRSGGKTYQDQKVMKKDYQDKRRTRP